MFLNLIETSDILDTSIDLITGFSWLVFRHPNVLEPCTDKLFARYTNLDDKTNNFV